MKYVGTHIQPEPHSRRRLAAALAVALALVVGAFFVGTVTATPRLAAAPADLNIRAVVIGEELAQPVHRRGRTHTEPVGDAEHSSFILGVPDAYQSEPDANDAVAESDHAVTDLDDTEPDAY